MHALHTLDISQPVVATRLDGSKVLLVPRNSLVRNFYFDFTDHEEPRSWTFPDSTEELRPSLLMTPAECFDAALKTPATCIWNYASQLLKKLKSLVCKST